jgi:hypothetical protein
LGSFAAMTLIYAVPCQGQALYRNCDANGEGSIQ